MTVEEQLRLKKEEEEEQERRKRDDEQREMDERRREAAKGIKRFQERVWGLGCSLYVISLSVSVHTITPANQHRSKLNLSSMYS